MTITLKETDAVVIGVGWTGSILARELTKVGLNVVGLERGARRMPRDDFTIPSVRDDLKYAVRQELFQDAPGHAVPVRAGAAETGAGQERAEAADRQRGAGCRRTTSCAATSPSATARTPFPPR